MKSPEFFDENYSLTESGLINLWLKKLKLDQKRWFLAILVLPITWLPLIIFAIDGKSYAGTGVSCVLFPFG